MFLIFLISYIQSYFPRNEAEKNSRSFSRNRREYGSGSAGYCNTFLLLFVNSAFIGFTGAGLPLGVTFVPYFFPDGRPRLTASAHEYFGSKIAVTYVVLGLVIAVAGGTLIEKLHMEKYVESFIMSAGRVDIESLDLTKKDRLVYAKEQMVSTLKKGIPTSLPV